MNQMPNLVDEGKKIFFTIIYIIVFISVIRIFQFQLWQTYLLILAIQVFWGLIKHDFNLIGFCKMAVLLALLFEVMWVLGRYGWIGFILSCFIVSGFILWRRRKKWLKVKHQIETIFWGKRLKDFKKGKDIPKIQIVVKK